MFPAVAQGAPLVCPLTGKHCCLQAFGYLLLDLVTVHVLAVLSGSQQHAMLVLLIVLLCAETNAEMVACRKSAENCLHKFGTV